MSAEATDKVRTIKNSQFGELEVHPEYIFFFPNGLLGFDDLHEFILINEEETEPFKWLLSLAEPEIGFPLLSPWHIDLAYDPGDIFNVKTQALFVVVTLENTNGSMTANFKAPLIFDIDKQEGHQVILPSDKFSPTHIIAQTTQQQNK
ncbi:MAG: flagellar assembly protein FliW [Candidatus Kapabacteria bacterium]|nr:flagellar assembly protein FliW [Candidatus Kapabacteria bacterium]